VFGDLSDKEEAGGKAIAEFLTPWNVLGRGEALINKVEGGEQQQGLVWLLVRSSFLKRRNADIEIVEAFDGGGEEHGEED